MTEKPPNILECDGLFIRGPSGSIRARISCHVAPDGNESAWLEMFGVDTREPSVSLVVGSDGQAELDVSYANDLETFNGVRIKGGNPESPPSFAFHGHPDRRPEPSFTLPGANADRT